MNNLGETLNNLISDFNASSTSLQTLQKDAHSRNISVADWNDVVSKIATNMDDLKRTYDAITDIVEFVGTENIEAFGDTVVEALYSIRESYEQYVGNALSTHESEFSNKLDEAVEHSKNERDRIEDKLNGALLDIEELQPATDLNSYKISSLEGRVEYLEELTISFTERSSLSPRNVVPVNASSKAVVTRIGGHSRRCENLIQYPETGIPSFVNGVVFTVNTDGSIYINGTVSGEAVNVNLWAPPKHVYGHGKYTVSGGTADVTVLARKWSTGGVNSSWIDSKGTAASGTLAAGESVAGVNIYIPLGTVVNTTIYPMFNFGTTAMPYEPYFKGFRHAKPSKLFSKHANLIPYPYAFTSTEVSGVTVTTRSDGFISFSGNCTGYGEVVIARNVNLGATRCAVGTGVSHGDNGVICVSKQGNTLGSNASLAYEPYGNGTIVSYLVSGATYSGGFYPMINFGTAPAKYAKYNKDPISTLYLPDSLQTKSDYGLGINEEYHNDLVLDTDYGNTLVCNCKQYVVDGSEGQAYTDGAYKNCWVIYYKNLYGKRIEDGISDRYPNLTSSEFLNGTVNGVYLRMTEVIVIRDQRFTDTATARSILAAEPVSFVLAFATETSTSAGHVTVGNTPTVEGGGYITTDLENTPWYSDVAYVIKLKEDPV